MGPCGDADYCLFADEDGAALLAVAYPAGRYQAEIQRLSAEHHAWLRDADGDDPFPPTDDSPPPAVRDEEFRKALRARAILGCRALAAERFAALAPAFDDADDRFRLAAFRAAVRLSGHRDLAPARPALAARIEATALDSADPWTRAVSARLLAVLDADPRALLADAHPGVRAAAALAPALVDDPRATRVILDSLLEPREADRWFAEHLPLQQGPLRFELIWAAVERVDDFDALLPAALAVLRLARIGTLDQDLGPFLTAAFPRPFRGGDTLSLAQHGFVAALTDREELHRGATSRPWYRRTGLPLGLDECRALCSAR